MPTPAPDFPLMLRLTLLTAALATALVSATACDDGGGATDRQALEADATPQIEPDAGAEVDLGEAADAGETPDAGPQGVERPGACADADAVSGEVAVDGLTLTIAEGALVDAQAVIPPAGLPFGATLTLDCADRLVPEPYEPLGPALSVRGPRPGLLEGEARITLVFSASDRPVHIKSRHLRLFWQPDNRPYVAEPPVMNLVADLLAGTFSFASPGLGTFQLGYLPEDGLPEEVEFNFKAISGISMGGAASAYLGMKYADRFDFVMPLGGPTDWPYLIQYIRGRLMGGFCAEGQGDGPGAACPTPPPSDPIEHRIADYNHWYYSDNGGSFDRSSYTQIFHDLAYAYGNPLMYNPDSPYLPPGLPPEWLLIPEAERCLPECRGEGCPEARPFTIAEGFYDDEYNPRGDRPVIVYCDGEDGEPRGVFNDDAPHTSPMELTYAVDLNGNGRRDALEPVIRNTWEPYADVGCDGVASAQEPGYDPVANPDPAGDDYHWYRNPHGIEGNWLYDDCGEDGAEPYEDFGLDGVPDTPQFADGGYDWGEGNGRFDYNPNLERFMARNPGFLYQALPEASRRRIRVWNDGGIRDIFNLGLAHSHFMARLQAAGENVRIYNRIPTLLQADVEAYAPSPDALDPFADRGMHVLLRYGRPNATQEQLDAGDGGHVGDGAQALTRFISMFDWLLNRWPDGNFDRVMPPYRGGSELIFFDSERFGKRYRYGVSLPPGYSDPANEEVRYPVLLVLHGYGQAPEDLPFTGALLQTSMARTLWQKAIVVYPEGFCGKATAYQCNDGVDNDGDGLVDAGNDAALRTACEGDMDCSGDDYTCRSGWCCPAGWADCGPPDDACGNNRGGRSETGEPLTLCSDGVDNDLDGLADLEDEGCLGLPTLDTEADCKRGSFYTTHPVGKDGRPGGRDFEGAMLDMLDDIDARYRTRPPERMTIIR